MSGESSKPNPLLALLDTPPPSDSTGVTPSTQQFIHFFAFVGHAITQWAHIDALLYQLFLFGLGAGDEKTATVFYASQTIGQHASMVDKLMQLSLPQKHRKAWKKIYKDINAHLEFRNHLAHDPVRFNLYEDYRLADLLQGRPARLRLDPYEIVTDEPKLLAKKAPRRTRFDQIIAHIDAVDAIVRQMIALRRALPGRARKLRATRPPRRSLPAKGSKKRTPRASAKR